jgi:hypothetical protein
MQRVFYFPVILLLVLFSILIFFHTDVAINQDLGRHLLLGRIILETKQVPKENLLSYVAPSFPFINHHWASEVIYFLIFSWGSIDGLILFNMIVAVSAVFGLLVYSLKRNTHAIFSIVSGILALETLRHRTDIRPEVFGYLFYSLFLIILFEEKEKERRWIWTLIPILFLWTNTHISFVFGILAYGFFLLDRSIGKKINRKYCGILILLLLITLINPNGIQGALYPLRIFLNYGYPIVENQSIWYLENYFHVLLYPYFKLAAIVSVLVSVPLLIKKKYFETSLLWCTGILSIFAVRHFPFFALSLLFPVSLGLESSTRQILKVLKKWKHQIKGTVFHLFHTIIYITVTVFLIREVTGLITNSYYVEKYSDMRTGFGQTRGGEGVANYFLSRKLSGPIFNNFDIGSYLAFRLYPNEKVFVDSRPEAYPSRFFTDTYISMQQDQRIWQEQMNGWKFKTIIFSHTDLTGWATEFLKRIVKDKEWKLAYFDEYGAVFVHENAVYDNLQTFDSKERIQTYAHLKIDLLNDRVRLMRFGRFLGVLGFGQLQKDAFDKAVGINS